MSLSSRSLAVFTREVLLFGSNMVTSLIVAHMLGPYLAGVWIILALIPSYAELLARIKADAAAVFYLGKGMYALGDVIFTLNAIALGTSALILLPILIWFDAFKEAVFGANTQNIGVLIYIMLMQIPINFLYLNYTYLHIHKENVSSLNIMVVTRALVSSAIIITSLVIFNLGLFGVVVGSTIGLLCALSIGVFRLGYVPRTGPLFNANLLRDLLQYGGKLYVGSLISHLNVYVSQAIVIAFCHPAQVAFFSIAQQLGQLINKVTDAMSTFLLPSLSKQNEKQQAAEQAARAFRIAVVILVLGGGCFALMMRPAVLILYGIAYEPVLIPFYIILPGLIVAACASVLMMFFQGVGRADLVAKVAIVPLILQVFASLVLVPKWGIIGGAVALLFTLLVTSMVQIIVFIKIAGLSSSELIIRWKDVLLVKDFIIGTIQRTFRISLSRS
ncbi:polysaccharide biosynthesis C-terminal domain-containing protein [Legionella maioricensis]|uniref:Polysaccharide biosynthesis C-terminal domain-containing protein n=1 Tax=Legionella maioricensis TaxID=2896528 RepID=A0A9X2CZY6_9GAMM|nr:polysaccharide biosynthesis C-terminal domain-containing protein [Legionella maioricensis]MCL9683565.1 polysaccharide biosynthesis C-terminal domain-containing protein [Legionella maioricensis]MCL9686864.1 polysaccharide biosynthesis C-terminal domain-containing protein [Legionella maioricensis]